MCKQKNGISRYTIYIYSLVILVILSDA